MSENLVNIPNIHGLEYLNCAWCTTLTNIPDTLTELILIICNGCINLVKIPGTLRKLTYLYCRECVSMIDIPDTLVELTTFDCLGCEWLRQNIGEKKYEERVKQLVLGQRCAKKWLNNYQRKRVQRRLATFVDELLMVSMNPDRIEWLGLF